MAERRTELTREELEELIGYKLFDAQWEWILNRGEIKLDWRKNYNAVYDKTDNIRGIRPSVGVVDETADFDNSEGE